MDSMELIPLLLVKSWQNLRGFIDDKGLVGELPQFQFTEYDTHNIRVTVVEGNCNQRKAVPGPLLL